MVFGIRDLQRDVQKFQQDIESAKVKYLDEHTEYVNITTELENIEQKHTFLQEEVQTVAGIFPESGDSAISNPAKGFLISGGVFLSAAGIGFMVKKFKTSMLIKTTGADITHLQDLRRVANADLRNINLQINALQRRLNNIANSPFADPIKLIATKNKLRLRRIVLNQNLNRLAGRINLVQTSQAMKQAKIAKIARIAKFTAGIGAVLGIIGVALAITSAQKRKEYLEQQKAELKQNLDDINGYIAEANNETKDVITVFLAYFDEFGIDVDGVFNDNQDGFLNASGAQKFEDLVSQLRKNLNGAIKGAAELNASTKLANIRTNRYVDRGLKGVELMKEVVFDTELPKELVQRLYAFKLRELSATVPEAIALSQLPEDLVEKLYAYGYLDDGKTIEEISSLSGLTEDRVRRIYASKLLDDELNPENQDGVIGLEAIAEKAGVSKEVVLDIQFEKLGDLLTDFEEEELEPELLAI